MDTAKAEVCGQQAFVERGLASLEDAKQSGQYVSSDELLRELDRKLADARTKARK